MSTTSTFTPERTAPGIYRGLPFQEYLRIRAVSRTTLLDLRRSPALCRWRRDHPQPETKAMALGTAIHTAILEPDRFEREYVVGPDVKLNEKLGKAEWVDFVALNPGKIHLRAKPGAQLLAIVESVRRNPDASRLLAGKGETELTVVWVDSETGVLCKCRIDRCYLAARGWVQLDLKSTRDAEPDAFNAQIARDDYDFQSAFYGDGLRIGMELDHDPTRVIIAYEKNKPEDGDDEELIVPPPLCSVHLIDPSAVEECRAEYRDLLAFYRRCDERDEWEDPTARINTYVRPHWKKRWTAREERVA